MSDQSEAYMESLLKILSLNDTKERYNLASEINSWVKALRKPYVEPTSYLVRIIQVSV